MPSGHPQSEIIDMRCLFCKGDSTGSHSEEHIIPESLGNTTSVLPPGVVCDRCNNYFSREVEKPFLESAAIVFLRFRQGVPSKRGIIPPMCGVLQPGFAAVVRKRVKGPLIGDVFLSPEAAQHLFAAGRGELIFPAEAPLPAGAVVSRFLAKAGFETMAQRVVDHPGGIDYLVDEAQMDPIRDHARRGTEREWPFHVRRIYDEDHRWIDSKGIAVQLVHESDILKTDTNEWYYILALFGLEFAINLGGPEVEGYLGWLSGHDRISPLYYGKNAGGDLR
jgi:hypothetical protein